MRPGPGYRAALGVLLGLSLLFFWACGRHKTAGHQVLISQVRRECLRQAPRIDEGTLETELLANLTRPLNDAHLPRLPFVKKVRCDTETRSALLAAAGTVYEFPVEIAAGSRLCFSFALDDGHKKVLREAVEFEIQFQARGRSEALRLFSRTLTMSRQLCFGWQDEELPLNCRGPGILRLITRKKPLVYPDRPVLAYWSNLYLLSDRPGRPEKAAKLIVVSLDSLRADHLRLYGYGRDTAPALDRLGRDAVLFENCWSQWHSTQVSHNSIFSGLFEESHQVPNLYPATPWHVRTLAEFLAERRYITAAFTGGVRLAADLGLSKGFDRYFDNETRQLGTFELADNWPLIRDWLIRFRHQPFFLFIHTYQIHSPYPTRMARYDGLYRQPADGDRRRMRLKVKGMKSFDRLEFMSGNKRVDASDGELIQCMRDYYDGSIRFTDDYLLRPLLQTLDELKLYEDTILVVLSDHGEEFFDHGRFYHNDALYQELIRVPLLIKPLGRSRSCRIATPVQTVDLLPTLLEMMSVPGGSGRRFDGRSLAAYLDGGRPLPARPVFSQSQSKLAVRLGDRKLILRSRIGADEQAFLPRIEAYRLDRDPGEKDPQLDDLSAFGDLYAALLERIVVRRRGLHLRIPPAFEGRRIDIELVNSSRERPIKCIHELGVTRADRSQRDEERGVYRFRWIGAPWVKELVVEPRQELLALSIRLTVDGRKFDLHPGPGLELRDGLFSMLPADASAESDFPVDRPCLYARYRKIELSQPALPNKVSDPGKIRTLGYLD